MSKQVFERQNSPFLTTDTWQIFQKKGHQVSGKLFRNMREKQIERPPMCENYNHNIICVRSLVNSEKLTNSICFMEEVGIDCTPLYLCWVKKYNSESTALIIAKFYSGINRVLILSWLHFGNSSAKAARMMDETSIAAGAQGWNSLDSPFSL